MAAGVLAVVAAAVVFHWSRDGGPPPTQESVWRDHDETALPDGTNRRDDFALGVHMFQGAEHCDWEQVTFLHIAWPPGSIAISFDDVRQFVRDRDHVLARVENLRGEFERNVEPPADASTTGVHTDDVELWIAPSNEDAVYLRHRDGTFDHWPRADPPILCQ